MDGGLETKSSIVLKMTRKICYVLHTLSLIFNLCQSSQHTHAYMIYDYIT